MGKIESMRWQLCIGEFRRAGGRDKCWRIFCACAAAAAAASVLLCLLPASCLDDFSLSPLLNGLDGEDWMGDAAALLCFPDLLEVLSLLLAGCCSFR
ncbi:hypothetical protein P167DRAFT_174261 [Morchella conica CCBAS932]|uniref:Uncharacterized protein n=1 Tax=Morchella conica CCBAS932 TaxID=1392247 RepID=A0A3N4KRY7_9PEZI|nr:hypothetical protein P167DRAFT_174261 [Morchella conica CCBAS932]